MGKFQNFNIKKLAAEQNRTSHRARARSVAVSPCRGAKASPRLETGGSSSFLQLARSSLLRDTTQGLFLMVLNAGFPHLCSSSPNVDPMLEIYALGSLPASRLLLQFLTGGSSPPHTASFPSLARRSRKRRSGRRRRG